MKSYFAFRPPHKRQKFIIAYFLCVETKSDYENIVNSLLMLVITIVKFVIVVDVVIDVIKPTEYLGY